MISAIFLELYIYIHFSHVNIYNPTINKSTKQNKLIISFPFLFLETPPPDNTDTLVEFVDMILKDQDYNHDGYIDYPEYISYYSKYDTKSEAETTP